MRKIAFFAILLTLMAPSALAQEGEITLVPFTSESFGIQGMVPEGWNEAASGVYARGAEAGDMALLAQQTAPAAADMLLTSLLPQLGLDEAPEPVETYETDVFTWDLYYIDVEAGGVEAAVGMALAEADGMTYIVMLQAAPEDYDALHEAVFMPAVDALAPLGAEEGEVYEDPDGLFSVPLPTNWAAEQHEDGYGILTAPDGEITVYVMALETEEFEAAVKEAWARVDPDFDLEPEDVIESPPANNAEAAYTLPYDTGDEDTVIVAGGWMHDGIAYIELFSGSADAFEKRIAQLQIIDTGFDIAALEKDDLTGMDPKPVDEAVITELEAYIEDLMARIDTVPGVAIAIVQDGEVVYTGAFGVRDRESGDPMTPDTLMMVGSTSKTMTTMLMAQLVDEGAMNWDTPVVEILPTFAVADPDITGQITVENLVCACTGVPRRDLELIFNSDAMTAEGIIESLETFEFFTDFGEAFQYSNQMVAAGGYVAAAAAGAEYGNLYDAYINRMENRIFAPIGMEHTTFSFEEVEASGICAASYMPNADGVYQRLPLKLEQNFLEPLAPAGAVWSTVEDMARYLLTELGEGVAPDGERVVSAENLAHTWEPQVAMSAQASYGLGWVVDDYKGLTMLHHGGNTLGHTSDMAFLPEAGLGISILSNRRASNALNEAIRFRLLELVYDQEPETDEIIDFFLEQTEAPLADLTPTEAIPRDVTEPYTGTWANDALGEITIAVNDDGMTLDAGEFVTEVRQRTSEEGETNYMLYEPPLPGLQVEFAEDGTVVLGSGVNEYVFERVE